MSDIYNIPVEKGININRNRQRYDLLIYNTQGKPVMIVECKAPGIEINQQVFDQAGRYNNMHKAGLLLVTNGIKHFCCSINLESRQYAFLAEIPDYKDLMDETLL
mgnify:CR=1 FL=1